MSRLTLSLIAITALAVFAVLPTSPSRAESARQPGLSSSPLELVEAVNALRLSYGLAPYSLSSVLMSTAQGQADFMAVTGSMTHAGPGGIGVTERLLAAGYPLAGDLSLGGFRSENITGGAESMSAQAAVKAWTSDAPHLTTMISPDLTEIGAGVAVSNGKVYYVIDCARPTNSGAPQAAVPSLEGGSTVPTRGANVGVILPVELSTPNADGDVYHEVKAGQSLWQIAIAYAVRIDDLKSLNGLAGNDIYPGTKLLVKKGMAAPTAFPTETLPPTLAATPTLLATSTDTATPDLVLTSTAVVLASSAAASNLAIMKIAIGAIALGLLGGGIFAWWLDGLKKKRSSH